MTRAVASADVAVVGCGIAGLAAAERLCRDGLTVVMADPAGIASGATGASGGLVRALDLSRRYGDRAAESLDVYLRRGPRGHWPAVREDGSLTLFGAGDLRAAHEAAGRLRAAGHAVELLTAADVAARFPALSPAGVLGGVLEPRAGWLPAREVAAALVRDAGGRLLVLEARATRLLTRAGRVTGVRTSAGDVTAGAVLLAAGVGSVPLAAQVGVDLPLCTRSVGYCLFAPDDTAAATGLPTVVDATTGAWLRRWDDGVLLAGVTSKETDVPARVTHHVTDAERHRVHDVVRRLCPALARARFTGGVTAYDAMFTDGPGAVTAWPAAPGLVTAVGWNGGGFKLAPAVGAEAAALLKEAMA
ncbi:FAD-dependent oxidoreductase [Streptomyces sp. ICBB 8177]|nr:FAD-dependent oxidoreductase [Streptomyces sp. ICBB 8177]